MFETDTQTIEKIYPFAKEPLEIDTSGYDMVYHYSSSENYFPSSELEKKFIAIAQANEAMNRIITRLRETKKKVYSEATTLIYLVTGIFSTHLSESEQIGILSSLTKEEQNTKIFAQEKTAEKEKLLPNWEEIKKDIQFAANCEYCGARMEDFLYESFNNFSGLTVKQIVELSHRTIDPWEIKKVLSRLSAEKQSFIPFPSNGSVSSNSVVATTVTLINSPSLEQKIIKALKEYSEHTGESTEYFQLRAINVVEKVKHYKWSLRQALEYYFGAMQKEVNLFVEKTVNGEEFKFLTIPFSQIKTQKAKGIRALKENGFKVPEFRVYSAKGLAESTSETELEILNGKFLRPCPLVPRHGFVDSRPVNSLSEIRQLVNETVTAEPEAEIISMPVLEAKYSGIWTDGKLIIGTGNDGATAGKDSVAIPAVGRIKDSQGLSDPWKRAEESAGITESPYLELVWTHDGYDTYTNFVQLRNGPKLPESVDFIPEKITVENIVLAEGDLLEWESKVKTFSKGTVVYHPNGSLASHYSVHAVLSGIPVVISFNPKVGEELEPNTKVSKPDVTKLRAGFIWGVTEKIDYKQAGLLMLAGCHSTAAWLGKEDSLLGAALGCAYRLIVTAALGEARHSKKRRRHGSRNVIYKKVWEKALSRGTRTRYLRAMEAFEDDSLWASGFGGSKWLEFSRFAGLIFNAVVDGKVKESLELLNQAVHAAHNNGWAFNKFLGEDKMNQAASSPLMTMLQIPEVLYQAKKKLASEEKEKEAKKWFKGRKHYDVDKIDDSLAEKDEQEETAEEPETNSNDESSNEENDCGCGNHACSDCYPDGCDCSCKDCHDSNDECESCKVTGKTIYAQAKLIKHVTDGKTLACSLHVQYVKEHQSKTKYYQTANQGIPVEFWETAEKYFTEASERKPKVSLAATNGFPRDYSLADEQQKLVKYVELTQSKAAETIFYFGFEWNLGEWSEVRLV